jgi:hypothetical protein
VYVAHFNGLQGDWCRKNMDPKKNDTLKAAGYQRNMSVAEQVIRISRRTWRASEFAHLCF